MGTHLCYLLGTLDAKCRIPTPLMATALLIGSWSGLSACGAGGLFDECAAEAECNGNTVIFCNSRCDVYGMNCRAHRDEVDCGETGEVCVEVNGDASCVFASREPCAPVWAGRCSADSRSVEQCAAVGFWRGSVNCAQAGDTCRPSQDSSWATCVLDPPEGCANDPEHRECRDKMLVTCVAEVGFLIGHRYCDQCDPATLECILPVAPND